MNILVTGGAGYIGTHLLVELISTEKNFNIIVVDSLVNSSREAIKRVEQITNKTVPFYEFDLRDKEKLDSIFYKHSITSVIHLAGLKAVGESTAKPLLYYRNNVDSSLVLLEIMSKHNTKKIIFSSSATVYGNAPFPYTERLPTGQGITSPYGQTKYFIERILHDLSIADETLEITTLRYFNPIGAHPSGLIGEDPLGIPNNLMPYITQVATGKRKVLNIFGNDYPTKDGTCVRDYIHVQDLAAGHVSALKNSRPGFHAYNLGTGTGVSVLELVEAFKAASNKKIPYKIVERRPGDLPEFYADSHKAQEELGWKTIRTLEQACIDSWNWQSRNRNGYSS